MGMHHVEEWAGEEWAVRPLAASQAAKVYRCPGCDLEIGVGVPHVVAWPLHTGVGERRHWHRVCWDARERRAPTRRR